MSDLLLLLLWTFVSLLYYYFNLKFYTLPFSSLSFHSFLFWHDLLSPLSLLFFTIFIITSITVEYISVWYNLRALSLFRAMFDIIIYVYLLVGISTPSLIIIFFPIITNLSLIILSLSLPSLTLSLSLSLSLSLPPILCLSLSHRLVVLVVLTDVKLVMAI